MSHRVVWQRISYDKGWHGGNQAKAVHPDATRDQLDAVAKCPFCDDYDSLDHIFRYCQHSNLPELRTSIFNDLSVAITATLSDNRCTQLNHDLAAAMRDMAATPLPLPTHTIGLHDGWRIWTGQWTRAHRRDLATRLTAHLPLTDQAKTSLRRTGKTVGTILARGAWTLWARRCQLLSQQENSQTRQLFKDDIALRFDKVKKARDKRHPIPAQRLTAHYPTVQPLPKITKQTARRIHQTTSRTNKHLLNKPRDYDSSDSDEDWSRSRHPRPTTRRTSKWLTFSTFHSDSEDDTAPPSVATLRLRKQRNPIVDTPRVFHTSQPRIQSPASPVICSYVYTQPLTAPSSDSLVRGRITS